MGMVNADDGLRLEHRAVHFSCNGKGGIVSLMAHMTRNTSAQFHRHIVMEPAQYAACGCISSVNGLVRIHVCRTWDVTMQHVLQLCTAVWFPPKAKPTEIVREAPMSRNVTCKGGGKCGGIAQRSCTQQ